MKKATSILSLLLLLSVNLKSQVLIESEHLATYGAFDIALILSQIGSPPEFNVDYDVDLHKIVYNTIDPKGNPTIASGAIAVPVGYECSFPIASYNHGTIVKKDEVPSNTSTEALIGVGMASSGYIVSLPDYLGLGDGPGLHPYVHAKSQATATIDMIYACKEFLDAAELSYNEQLFLFGYSQGGHACMATHKEIEENPSYGLTVTASAPMSGPYDISGIQTQYLVDDIPYDSPGYLPYVVLAYQQVYDYLPQDPSEIFVTPYDTLLPTLFDGTNTFGSINSQVPAIPNEMILPDVFEAFTSDPDHPLRVALRDNDVYDWSPTAPIHMFYCTEDEQVNFENALLAGDVLTANGGDIQVTDGGPLTHGGCVAPALIGGKAFFDSYREEGLVQNLSYTFDPLSSEPLVLNTETPDQFEYQWWFEGEETGFSDPVIEWNELGSYGVVVSDPVTGCSETFTFEVEVFAGIDDFDINFTVFPNPATEFANLSVDEVMLGERIQLFGSNGALHFDNVISSANQTINIADLNAGVYLLVIGNRYESKLVKH